MATGDYVRRAGSLSGSTGNRSQAVTVSGVTVGNTLVCAIASHPVTFNENDPIGTVTDNQGNTWTLLLELNNTLNVNSTNRVSVWICQPAVAPTTVTVAWTAGTSNYQASIVVDEFEGLVEVDQTAGLQTATNGSGTPGTITTGSTTVAVEMVYVSHGAFQGPSHTWTETAGYTKLAGVYTTSGTSQGASMLCEYKKVSSTGTQSATGTFATFSYIPVVAVTLKASAVPPSAFELVGAVPI